MALIMNVTSVLRSSERAEASHPPLRWVPGGFLRAKVTGVLNYSS